MVRKFLEQGPEGLDEIWHQVFDHLVAGFWSHKGLSGSCPFCGASSDSSKMRFLIFFKKSEFKGYSCFVCGKSGSGFAGAQHLFKAVGLSVSALDLERVLRGGQSQALSSTDTGKEPKGPIEWPPKWINETDEVFAQGYEYLKKRNILWPDDRVNKHEIYFSSEVLIDRGFGAYLKPYPCLVAPMHDESHQVLGFITRKIGETNEGEPKSIDQSGSEWKTKALFGLACLDPRKPVTIVEGLFSALSTPNAVACGGKKIHSAQIDALAATGARVFIFALDPEVKKRAYADAMYRLTMAAPGAKVVSVDWSKFEDSLGKDPNDLGEVRMAEIIRQTLRASLSD